jgi:hypothetical protein
VPHSILCVYDFCVKKTAIIPNTTKGYNPAFSKKSPFSMQTVNFNDCTLDFLEKYFGLRKTEYCPTLTD